MKVIGVVPARSGSKGLRNKNLKKIGDKTLLELAVKVGVDSEIINDVYISTDCKNYEDISIKTGAKSICLRKKSLSKDDVKSVDVVIDLINKLDVIYDYLVLLQPTSPIRKAKDIKKMFQLIVEKDADACVSLTKLTEPHPNKLKIINNKGYVKSFLEGTSSELPRQHLPELFALNGSLYIIKLEALLSEKTFFPNSTLPYLMKTKINIDTEEDFILLEAMLKRGIVEL